MGKINFMVQCPKCGPVITKEGNKGVAISGPKTIMIDSHGAEKIIADGGVTANCYDCGLEFMVRIGHLYSEEQLRKIGQESND